jgi:ubiquinone/menaquinone biosynthesis C-methylase UbiE
MRTDLGEMSDMQLVRKLVNVDGLTVLDVGCGSGANARGLAELGATVVGLEPDPVQAQLNRQAEPTANVTLPEGRAHALPQPDDSVDGVFFFRSMHHVPAEAMDAALTEAKRVVRPGGFVFALEPGIKGSHTAMMRPFHNEDVVRGLAQEALGRAATDCPPQQYSAVQYGRYDSFEQLVSRFAAMSFNAITAEMMDVPVVRDAFSAGHQDDGFVFDQPILIDLFRVDA